MDAETNENTYILDTENPVEMGRLIDLGRMITYDIRKNLEALAAQVEASAAKLKGQGEAQLLKQLYEQALRDMRSMNFVVCGIWQRCWVQKSRKY